MFKIALFCVAILVTLVVVECEEKEEDSFCAPDGSKYDALLECLFAKLDVIDKCIKYYEKH